MSQLSFFSRCRKTFYYEQSLRKHYMKKHAKEFEEMEKNNENTPDYLFQSVTSSQLDEESEPKSFQNSHSLPSRD